MLYQQALAVKRGLAVSALLPSACREAGWGCFARAHPSLARGSIYWCGTNSMQIDFAHV